MALEQAYPTKTSETTSWTQIDVLTLSDIHLGNAANPAEFVIKGLEKKLTLKYMNGVNILFIAGDVFDRGLPLNHRDVPFITSWIRRLLARCARLGIVVLVLEGTPSHDRLQSHLFVAINDAAEENHKCDLRYVKEVSIEYIEQYNLNVLCIPDEKNTSDEVTYQQVLELMKARALDKVDFAVMHGFFDFQVPMGRSTRFHIADRYKAIVKYLIFIGHDHTHRQVDNIFVQGSPDRQRHGTEEDKGFVRATVYCNGTYEATFEVNEHAMVFKTITVDDDVDTASAQIHAVCDKHPHRSHIRIAARGNHPIMSAIDSFKLKYPFISFTKKVLDEETDKVENVVDAAEEEYVPFTIDSSNIKSVVHERLSFPLQGSEKEYFDNLMESVT